MYFACTGYHNFCEAYVRESPHRIWPYAVPPFLDPGFFIDLRRVHRVHGVSNRRFSAKKNKWERRHSLPAALMSAIADVHGCSINDSENKEEAQFISSNLPESSEVNGSDPGFARSAAPMSVCFQGRFLVAQTTKKRWMALKNLQKTSRNLMKFGDMRWYIWGY